MRTNYVVGGYVCMIVLAVFSDSTIFLPFWVSGPLWIALAFCYSKVAILSEPGQEKWTRGESGGGYLNSPKKSPAATRAALRTVEISRGRCREHFENVKCWKEENFNASWDHPTAAAIFAEFSRILNTHIEEFPDDKRQPEVWEWVRFAEEVRRNQN